jgi:hypothetical protein
MINEYISAAMKEARYDVLEDGSFYGEIEGLKGVWTNNPSFLDAVSLTRSRI